MTTVDPNRLADFTKWVERHITGDEKGQAQIFLDRLFVAFGHPGSLDVGGTPEFRIRKTAKDGGGTSFADFVWKPIVLVEMKRRGEKLGRHYRQAFDYWTRLVPNRPRYVVLCNFDEFEIYDFETQMDAPVGRLALADLPMAYGSLAFLLPGHPTPIFHEDHVAVTRAAATRLAKCFRSLTRRGIDRNTAQRFTLQMLVALFSEDIGLLPKYFVTRLLEECDETSSFDLLGGLFTAMNTERGASGGRFKGVPYFNGGLFAEPARVELTTAELELLRACCASDWSMVRPEIFGTVFEQTLSTDERHAQGAHFTYPADIMKIVGPTIVEPWREQIAGAKTARRLGELLQRLQHFRVLDPACGSGNFLYIAYRELKRIEAEIFARLETFKSKAEGSQMRLSYLSAQNFYGLDKNSFAVELAKVTMMIARKLAIDELHITEAALPLANLDDQIRHADALIECRGDGSVIPTPWPAADVIIGNPPFLGAKRMKPELTADYMKLLRQVYHAEVPGMADQCVYWIRRARDHIPPCTAADPVAGRAGLVGTQNIRNNASRIGGLDHVVESGTIIDAVDNQPWSGEADVNVSIVNWVNSQDKAIMPKKRRLWFAQEPSSIVRKLRQRDDTAPVKIYDLSYTECERISASLSCRTDVTKAKRLACNQTPQRVFQGITHGHEGFVLTPEERKSLIRDGVSHEVTFPYMIGREFVSGDGLPKRYVIDFGERTVLEASQFHAAIERVKKTVLVDRQAKAEKGKDTAGNQRSHHKGFLERWWRLSWDRAEMKVAFRELSGRYIAASRTQRWPFIFAFVSTRILPGDKLQTFAFDDDYSFGVLQATPHLLWYQAKAARLKNEVDYNYSTESVFETYPWPQAPTGRQVRAVAHIARELNKLRAKTVGKFEGGLRGLYHTLELPGANPLKDIHAELDAAVCAAYGFSQKKDLLAQIRDLNFAVADRIALGESVVSPGVPPSACDRRALISNDCIGLHEGGIAG